MWALSRTATRSSFQQCDNPTWSHTALLSWFHTRCRSSFRLHIQQSAAGGSPVKSLQSHCFHTQFHGPVVHPFASRHEGPGSILRGVLMWNWDPPVSVVSLHQSNFHWLCSPVHCSPGNGVGPGEGWLHYSVLICEAVGKVSLLRLCSFEVYFGVQRMNFNQWALKINQTE